MNSIVKSEFQTLIEKLKSVNMKDILLNIFSKKQSESFNHNLMVVGRYNIGAHPDCVFKLHDSFHKVNRLISALEIHESSMSWVSDFENVRRKLAPGERRLNTKRIPFWRVTKQVAMKGELTTDICWSDQISWTNLYKIAINNRIQNEKLFDYQRESATTILLQEIKDSKPKNILFLTDWENWAQPFIEKHLKDITLINENNVILTATLQIDDVSCHAIVCGTPQGNRETELSDKIVTYIKH